MENNIIIQFLRYSSFVLLFIAISAQAESKTVNSLFSSPIYYGDSEVNTGQPFSITCIIPVSEEIKWYKDGETITKHNLRHGRDDHAFIESENAIEGEGEKIEGTISVRHALALHEGKYQCNSQFSNYHYLKVRRNERHSTVPQPDFGTVSPPYSIRSGNRPTTYDNYDLYFTDSGRQRVSSTLLPNVTRITNGSNRRKMLDFNEKEQIIDEDILPTTAYDPAVYTNMYSPKTIRVGDPSNKDDNSEEIHINRKKPKYPYGSTQTIDNEFYDRRDRIGPTTSTRHLLDSGEFLSSSRPSIYSTARSTTQPPALIVSTEAAKPVRKDDPEITPNYDNVEQKLKVFEIKSVLSINCNISKDNGYELTWEKNHTDVRKVESLKNRYEIREKERTFYIARSEQIDEGIYTCSIKSLNISKEIEVIADVYVRLQETTGVVEGEKLTITCQVAGTEPDVKWKIGDNLTISETTGRYIIEDDDEQHVPKAKLIIESAEESDRNNYYCSASNKATQYTNRKPALTKTFVRVKGKLAALWPFLGICAEVFILCAIILIYEKRRNKTELDESDTDPNTEQKKKRRNYD